MTPRTKLIVALASGALFALAAPPLDWYPALWLGMAGLAFALGSGGDALPTRSARLRAGSLRGAAFGVAANVVALRFVPDVIVRFTPLPWTAGALALLLLSIAQSARFAVAAMVTAWAKKRSVPGALAFGIGIYAGTFAPAVFPWSAAGGVSPWPAMVQLAELVGERGVTFLMALTSGLAAESLRALVAGQARRRAAIFAAAAILLPLATWGYGRWRIGLVEALRARAPRMTIGLVQPSIEASERWDEARAAGIVARLASLTRSAESRGAELTVWPEAAFPYTLNDSARYDLAGDFAVLQPGVRGPVLAGLMMRGKEGSYNSAAVVTAGRIAPPYHKMHLLAFGEGVPLAGTFPWIRSTFARGLGLAPGHAQVLQQSGPARIAVLNCFEDTLPEASLEAAAVSPNLLANITNDAWFFGSAESELHLRLSVLRAVELRRDMVRAVNRGPTSWIDAAGVVRGRLDGGFASTLIAEPALLEHATAYSRAGDWPLGTMLALVIAGALWRTKHNGRRGKTAAPEV